jgi:hypothetical protein
MPKDPWVLPPIPEHGDANAEHTYAAVGRALSVWEELEVTLSYLYGLFSGKNPKAIETYTEYGQPTIFNQRAAALERLGKLYFARHPNQQHEGDFGRLICDIRRFSARRNDIAHSIVKPVQLPHALSVNRSESTAQIVLKAAVVFCLAPPTYTDRKFDANRAPRYLLTSVEIMRFHDLFQELQERVERLHWDLLPPSSP